MSVQEQAPATLWKWEKNKAELLNPVVGMSSEWGKEEVISCALHLSQPES